MQTPANVKALATDHPPESEVSAQFQRDGHRLLRRVALKEEMAAYRPVVLEAREEYGAEATSIGQRDTYGKAFRNGLNLRREEEGLQRCVGARRFATLQRAHAGLESLPTVETVVACGSQRFWTVIDIQHDRIKSVL